MTFTDGLARVFRYKKIGDAMVVTRVRTGDEDLRVKFKKVGESLVTVEMEFRHVFGRGWGPEIIKMRGVSLR